MNVLIRTVILIVAMFCTATLLGLYGQDLSYFFNDNVKKIAPIFYLTILTMSSIFLYVVTAVILYILIKKRMIRLEKFEIPLFFGGIVTIATSFWSVFVLIMWWG